MQLTFPVSVVVRTVRIYLASDGNAVRSALVRLYSDSGATTVAAETASGAIGAGGTDVAFADVPARSVRVSFTDADGTQVSLSEIEVIAAGAGVAPAPPTTVVVR